MRRIPERSAGYFPLEFVTSVFKDSAQAYKVTPHFDLEDPLNQYRVASARISYVLELGLNRTSSNRVLFLQRAFNLEGNSPKIEECYLDCTDSRAIDWVQRWDSKLRPLARDLERRGSIPTLLDEMLDRGKALGYGKL